MKFTGHFHLVWELFHDLPGDVVQLVWAFSFRHFIVALPIERGRSDHYSLFALIERWMDTTHTFHTRVASLLSPGLLLEALQFLLTSATATFLRVREASTSAIC